jgi:alpha/beta superfamily hydrolase
MQNKVVHTLCRSFNELSAATLRFNFRGVGGSEGHFGEGQGETADAIAACDWLKAHYPAAELWLAGFSFGAMVACNAALSVRPTRLVSVAVPAARTRRLLAGRQPVSPWLVVQGDADGVVDSQDVIAWVGQLAPAPTLVVLPGVDHFFHGNLTVLHDTVIDWFRSQGKTE